MSSMTITDKTAAAYRNRRAAEIAAQRRAMAESMDSGMESLSGFVSKFRVELATGTLAGLALFAVALVTGLV
jgi:hypothetical protein